MPIVMQRQAPQIQTVLKTVEALPVLFLHVVMQPQAPQILTVVKTVYVPPLLFHRQICGPHQECIWCIFEGVVLRYQVATTARWCCGRAGLVDQQACSGSTSRPCDTRGTAFACAGNTKRRRNGDEVLYSSQQQVGRVTSDAWTTAMVFDMVLPITSLRLL